jgi:hypothetical protein
VGVGGWAGNYFAWVAPIKGNLVALLFWGLIEGLMATFYKGFHGNLEGNLW